MKDLYIYYCYNYHSIMFFLLMFSGMSIFSTVRILLDYERLSKTFVTVVLVGLVLGIIAILMAVFLPNMSYVKYLLLTDYGVTLK